MDHTLKLFCPCCLCGTKKVNDTILLNKVEIKILEFEAGFENSQKHMDTKLVILVKNSRLVLHTYNSTQKLMVQGQNYEEFALNCLKPFFKEEIEEHIEHGRDELNFSEWGSYSERRADHKLEEFLY